MPIGPIGPIGPPEGDPEKIDRKKSIEGAGWINQRRGIPGSWNIDPKKFIVDILRPNQEQPEVVSDSEEYQGKVTSYGQQLRYELKLRGLTEKQLAEMIGVDEPVVKKWETNRLELDSASRRELSKILGNDYYLSSEVMDNGELRVRIVQRELTTQSVATIIPALTELQFKCWLIVKGRYAELIEYAQTRNIRFAEEANLVITRIEYNSPFEITFAPLDPKNIAEAINEAVQAKQKLIALKIANQEKAEKIQQDAKRAEQEYQAKQQELAIAAQKAAQESQMAQMEQERLKFELEKQRLTFQIEHEKQKLELERQQVAIQKEQLELVTMRINYDIETANKMIGMLQPDADQMTRAMLAQTLLPSLLQLDSSKGLNLALPVPQNS